MKSLKSTSIWHKFSSFPLLVTAFQAIRFTLYDLLSSYFHPVCVHALFCCPISSFKYCCHIHKWQAINCLFILMLIILRTFCSKLKEVEMINTKTKDLMADIFKPGLYLSENEKVTFDQVFIIVS